VAYTLGSSALKESPPQGHFREQHNIPARPISSSVDGSLRGIPSFNLLELTPEERKRRWLMLGISPLLEGLAICAVALALMAMPHEPVVKFARQEALMFRLATPPPAVRHIPQMVKQPPVENLHAAPVIPKMRQTEAPKPELSHLTTPRIAQPIIELPKPAPAPVTFASVRRPPLPVRRLMAPVRTGNFTPGSAAQGTLKRPLREIQTGGFGADNGIPGDPQDDSHTKLARLGSFDLPQGAGQGNGTDGAQGVRGAVASAGFGNAVGSAHGNGLPGKVRLSGFRAAVGSRQDGASLGNVRQGGFGSVVAGNQSPRTRAAALDGAFQPVEILSKPDPVYPAEARQLHLEGDVILSVDFEASGKLDILKVVKGLGHGMDQAAIQAAESIRFKPAQRDGRPVDSRAMVHIIFQLAY
jgi:TonB family protein